MVDSAIALFRCKLMCIHSGTLQDVNEVEDRIADCIKSIIVKVLATQITALQFRVAILLRLSICSSN